MTLGEGGVLNGRMPRHFWLCTRIGHSVSPSSLETEPETTTKCFQTVTGPSTTVTKSTVTVKNYSTVTVVDAPVRVLKTFIVSGSGHIQLPTYEFLDLKAVHFVTHQCQTNVKIKEVNQCLSVLQKTGLRTSLCKMSVDFFSSGQIFQANFLLSHFF